MARMHAVNGQDVTQQAVKPQDSGQPRPGTPGDPLADRNDENHPGVRRRPKPNPKSRPAEGNDPSLTQGRTRTRKPG